MNGLDVENVCEVTDVLTNILINIEDMVDKADHKRLDLADAGGLRVLAVLLTNLGHLQSHHVSLRADESPSAQVAENLNHPPNTAHISVDLILGHALLLHTTNKVPDHPEHVLHDISRPANIAHLADRLRRKINIAIASLFDLKHQAVRAVVLAV